MATMILPDMRLYRPERMEFSIRDSVIVTNNVFGQSYGSVEVGFALWIVTMRFGSVPREQQHERAGFFAGLRGRVNRLRLWQIDQPQPFGTLRGSPVLAATALQGATTASINNAGQGLTLKRGDMIGINGMLCIVRDNSVSNAGTMTVTFEPPLRKPAPTGTPVVWDRPSALFMLDTSSIVMPFEPRVSPGFVVSLMEDMEL